MVTLRDIAESAGVSVMTVSRALQKPDNVNEKTRKRIEAIALQMGYRPNALAQSLIRNRTNNVLVIIPDMGNFFFPEMITNISSILRQYGQNVLIASSFGQISEEKRLLEMACSKMVDGVIMLVPRVESEYLEEVGNQFPLVVTDRHFKSEHTKQVYLDDSEGAEKAVDYLISKGHRHIGLIEGPESVQVNLRRKIGFCTALKKHQLDVDTADVYEGDYSFQEGKDAFEYFHSRPDSPTAYFATNDVMAIGFIQSATERKIVIPRDYSIIGFDNSTISTFSSPALTTIDHPKSLMGVLAAWDLLVLMGFSVEIPEIFLSNELVIRSSVANHNM